MASMTQNSGTASVNVHAAKSSARACASSLPMPEGSARLGAEAAAAFAAGASVPAAEMAAAAA